MKVEGPAIQGEGERGFQAEGGAHEKALPMWVSESSPCGPSTGGEGETHVLTSAPTDEPITQGRVSQPMVRS